MPRHRDATLSAAWIRARVIRLPVNDGLDGGVIPTDPDVGAHAGAQNFTSPLDPPPITLRERLTVEQVELRGVSGRRVADGDLFGSVEVGADAKVCAALAATVGGHATVIQGQIISVAFQF